MYYVLKLGEGRVLELEQVETHGLATQKAHEYTDDGFLARVVPEEQREECLYYMDHVQSKRDYGFIPEYGKVPNGHRSKRGSLPIGRMIFPAFGGKFEGQDNGSHDKVIPVPLPSRKHEPPKPRVNSILTINV